MSIYYRCHELAWRYSLWYSAGVLSVAFGGLLAYAIAKMRGIGGYDGWRWIFIIEGLFTFCLDALFKVWAPNWPEQSTKLLTPQEKDLLERRPQLDKSSEAKCTGSIARHFFGFSRIGKSGSASSCSLPYRTCRAHAVLRSYDPQGNGLHGFSGAGSYWAVAGIVGLIVAWVSDRLRDRYALIMLAVVLGSIGLILLLCGQYVSVSVRYVSLFFIVTRQPSIKSSSFLGY